MYTKWQHMCSVCMYHNAVTYYFLLLLKTTSLHYCFKKAFIFQYEHFVLYFCFFLNKTKGKTRTSVCIWTWLCPHACHFNTFRSKLVYGFSLRYIPPWCIIIGRNWDHKDLRVAQQWWMFMVYSKSLSVAAFTYRRSQDDYPIKAHSSLYIPAASAFRNCAFVALGGVMVSWTQGTRVQSRQRATDF
jgi:hypothetical protein